MESYGNAGAAFSILMPEKNQLSNACTSHSNFLPNSKICYHHFLLLSEHQDLKEEKQKIGYENDLDRRHETDFCSNSVLKERTDDAPKIDFSSCEEEKSVEGLFKSIDVSDLSFFSNNFLLEDFNCLGQASSKDCEITSHTFNNTDNNGSTNDNYSVQLLKSNLNDCHEYCTNLHMPKNYNLSQKNNLKNNKILPQKIYKELIDNCKIHNCATNCATNESNQLQKKALNEEEKEDNVANKVFGNGPIKKGRRYLPSFKKKVLEYVKNHTHKEAASHFQINNNTITEWLRENNGWPNLTQRKKLKKVDWDKLNQRTDKIVKPLIKTEIICLETGYNNALLKKDVRKSEASSPPKASFILVKPDEMFLNWIGKRRLQKKELSRQEVFKVAKYFLKKHLGDAEPSPWFIPWLNRYNRVLNSSQSNTKIEKYIKYPNDFKLEVVLYARLFTKNSAARVFNVSRKRTFEWCSRIISLENSVEKDKPESAALEKNKVEFCNKKEIVLKKDKIYEELHLWYQSMFFKGSRPTSNDIKEKAREIFLLNGLKQIKFSDGWLQKFCQRTNIKLRHSEDDDLLMWILTQYDNNVSLSHQDITEKSGSLIGRKHFKGSKGWTLRFLKRHKNLLQHSPTFADQLPFSAQQNLTLFWENFKQNLASFKIKAENIGCMDEIPLTFSYPEESNTASLPLLRKTGFENYLGIVILSSLANGRLLPPAVVFKGNEPKQLFSIKDLNILVLYDKNGLITPDILESWINHTWLSFAENPSTLVVDSFEPHRKESLARILAKKNCLLHIIPEGCSSKFQPLDVSVTPTFKNCIKNRWKEFSAGSEIKSPKISRKYRYPDKDTILHWVQIAYEKVNRNPVSIINSFKTTGLLA